MHKEWLHELNEELEYLKHKAPQPWGHAIYERLESRLRPIVLEARAEVNTVLAPKPASLRAAVAASMRRETEKRAEALSKISPNRRPARLGGHIYSAEPWL
jgi:hypothetical protein